MGNRKSIGDSTQFLSDVAMVTEGVRSAFHSMDERLGYAEHAVDTVVPLVKEIDAAMDGQPDDLVAMAAWMFLMLTVKRKFERGEMVPIKKPS